MRRLCWDNMRGSRTCEILAWRLAWLARLVARGERDRCAALRSGGDWQNLVFATARATRPYIQVQGPGEGKLFGRYGSSGMPAEFDSAIDDGVGILTLVESKAVEDYRLRRDEALIFSAKVQDHQRARAFCWQGVHALMASAGRLDNVFCRWAFHEGVDVLDPDRLPLIVLARLPYFLSRDEFAMLQDHQPYDRLRDALRMTREECVNGPLLLRNPERWELLNNDGILHDLNDIQARLSDSVWTAMLSTVPGATGEEREAALFGRAQANFETLGVFAPGIVSMPPKLNLGERAMGAA
jgi:hypothetical protein